ncbi:MAG TPA: ATP-dependent helicase [Dermatophilaceae bacterium]|nr:ATP-dependent helicase [Dermatophilaceae bacterium]
MAADVLAQFSVATRAWFTASFAEPTAAQRDAWQAIASGAHTLVVAPTGSGKTLSAFLWALDRLATTPPPDDALRRCRVLYVSPLKALAVDVERNLRSPLVGIGHAARRLGQPVPDVSVAVRSGDTPAEQRRVFSKRPSDILITTPESLFLLLTSRAREALTGVETVILDEVHAVAGTKRGAHLAVTLARLDALLDRPAQRIGLSATVRPVEIIGEFLTGGRPVSVVQPDSPKEWDVRVVVPVPDLGELGQATDDLSGPAAGAENRASIWPHVEERIADLVGAHRTTLVFANSRRLAERLTARLNELWDERRADPPRSGERQAGSTPLGRYPAQVAGQAGISAAAPPLLARAHHGSVSREERAMIEEDLKSGRLPAVVATSSLELGIDMGAIDLVVQVESPPSVASGLQRVGRAGHQVGAVSRGVIFPKYRADLVQTAVVVDRMRSGQIEEVRIPANPLDVLAQHVVAMCAMDEWPVGELHELMRRTASFAQLSRPVLDSVLDMLAGRYPSDDFAQLRPRVVWDRSRDILTGRPGAQRLAVLSGGTIPDRGLYGVFLAGSEGSGRRVGELDEEMVYESRVGDVFTLGTTSWRIEDITHDRVLVTPAPGVTGKLPFWKGDAPGRPAELGAAVGQFVREVSALTPAQARRRVLSGGLDEWATDNLLTYLTEQREATGYLPTDRTIVVERFRDEIGDWRIVIHSPYGAPVHAPWALCISAALRERFGLDVQAMHSDDGIVLRLPDMEADPGGELRADRDGAALDLANVVMLDPDDVTDLVTTQIGGSALFASRFRECAARALLLPRRRPDRRQALWQQRQRSARLLEVASRYPTFPIVLEAVRECVRDVFDVPALIDLMRHIADRSVSVVSVDTPAPSPFARSLLFGYVAQFLYEGDSPLAERRAAALSLDPALLAELLGGGDGGLLRDLLDPAAVEATEAQLQLLTPDRQARCAEDVVDVVRRLGPLSERAARDRCRPQLADRLAGWLAGLEQDRRLVQVRIAGRAAWAVVEDASRLRDGLGVALPVGLPSTLLDPTQDPLGELAARFARTRGPFTAAHLAGWLGIGSAVAVDVLRRLVARGRLVEGELRPPGSVPVGLDLIGDPPDPGGTGGTPAGTTGRAGLDYCDADVLRTLRRRSLAALRSEVEPVTGRDLARFLPGWQGVGGSMRGLDGLARAVEQLAGALLPVSAVESLVLPARVADYSPALLDQLLATGEVTWQGHAELPGGDGWISLHPADTAPLTLRTPAAAAELSPLHQAVCEALAAGGGFFFGTLSEALGPASESDLARVVWELVWAGLLTNDSFTAVRASLSPTRAARRSRAGPGSGRQRTRPAARGLGSLGGRRPALSSTALAHRTAPAHLAGRWSLLPALEPDPTLRGFAAAEVLLDRHGVLTRPATVVEDIPGGFAAVYRVLATAEDAGKVRRGYFVEGLGASQFASVGAVDRLRAGRRGEGRPTADPGPQHRLEGGPAEALVLAATDPANPYGAALGWPDRAISAVGQGGEEGSGSTRPGHRPGRKAGALVVLLDGELVWYVERGGRTLLTFTEETDRLESAAYALARTVHDGALGRLTVERADGGSVLGSAHPAARALAAAGFHATPRGLRLRR